MNTTHIVLFDVDGVLVEDRGYHAGINATLNYFGQLMGIDQTAIDDTTREVFHAHGYTNEWDLCPFTIGAMIVEALRHKSHLKLQTMPLDGFLKQFNLDQSGPIPCIDYLEQTDRFAGTPSERAQAVLLEALASIPLDVDTRLAVESTLREILADPYNITHSIITQILQEHVLGSSAFEETYRLRSRFDVPSLLYSEDRSLLEPDAKHTLDRLALSERAKVCVYTARPSLPPLDDVNWLTEAGRRPIGYSPEAELALQLIGLEDYPLIAMGRMQWLAARVKQPVEYLTKPAPVQALAAIGAALSRQEAESLTAAYTLVSRGELIGPLIELRGQSLEVWAVEDAVLGLHAARGAIDLLRRFEIDAHLHSIGISRGGPKADALAPLCEVVLANVNEAIDYIARAIK